VEYSVGDYVVYGVNGVCKFDRIESKNFSGKEERYCILLPIDSKSSTYYVEEEKLPDRVRKVMTEPEILALIDSMPDIPDEWDDDNNQRKSDYREVLQSGDFRRLIGLTRALYGFREKQRKHNKKLPVADDKSMKAAENILYSEFAFVLKIPYESVESFITDRLDSCETAAAPAAAADPDADSDIAANPAAKTPILPPSTRDYYTPPSDGDELQDDGFDDFLSEIVSSSSPADNDNILENA
jgi:CarD family transcriptional regulator